MYWVVVSNILYFQPYLGKWSILTNIFQMGWNHQLDVFSAKNKGGITVAKSSCQPVELGSLSPLRRVLGPSQVVIAGFLEIK